MCATEDKPRPAADRPDVVVYTDGACSGNPGPGGWAAILEHPATGACKELSGGHGNTTNNRMELTAAIEGLRALRPGRRLRVHLVSDSQYVIYGLTQWMAGWIANDWRRGKKLGAAPVKNVDLWKALYALTQRHDMSFEFVRGHAGHPENEACHRLATKALKACRQGSSGS